MKARALLAALAACVALGGCGPSVNYKYHIAVVPKGLTHEHWQSVHRGADRAAADLAAKGIPVEIVWVGPKTENDASEQINLVGLQSNAGINGLVLAPQDSKQMVGPVGDVVKKGIPVVILDSGLDNDALKKDPSLQLKYVATDNFRAGYMAGEELLKMLTKDGKTAPKLLLFRYQPGSESTEQREAGFLKAVKEAAQNGKDGPTVVAEDYAGSTVDSAEKVAGPLLDRIHDKDIDGLFAVNESATNGLLNALVSKGLSKKYKFMGFDCSGPLIQALKEGDVDGLIVQDPYRMGYLGVWTVVRHLEGDDVEPGTDLDSGEFLLTKANLDDPEMRGKFDAKLQAQRSIAPPAFEKKRRP
jgi:ribose transport system substrate-binding protein